VWPLELVRERGRTMLVLEDPGGEPLARLLGAPMEVGSCLRLAIGIVAALGKVHQRGLVHKNIKPAHILVNSADGQVRLTGFGIASRLPRKRQAPEPPETIAGTLAFMAPEQTGRMNRSIDARSDLYAFGVTLYPMLTGNLPFTAADPMEWVHCHIARQPVPPADRLPTGPEPVSALILKLLAKTVEERYQTAAGVERPLAELVFEDGWQSVLHDPVLARLGRAGTAGIRSQHGSLDLGPAAHSCQELHRQRRGTHGGEAELPAASDSERSGTARLSGECRRGGSARRGARGPDEEATHAALWDAVQSSCARIAPTRSFTTVSKRRRIRSFRKASGPWRISGLAACSRP
jgi:serine/threonine protein kinase